jgi:hypothetical protein
MAMMMPANRSSKELSSIHNWFREKHITGARRHYGMCEEEDTYKMVNAIQSIGQ